jgi:hypothetical protein
MVLLIGDAQAFLSRRDGFVRRHLPFKRRMVGFMAVIPSFKAVVAYFIDGARGVEARTVHRASPSRRRRGRGGA